MLRKMKAKLAQLVTLPDTPLPVKEEPVIVDDPVLGVKRRHYATYRDYLAHQAEKLSKVGDSIVQSDQEYEQLVIERYRDRFDFCGKTVLCLGARLGGEVRAFKTLGALAVGIDIEPGPNNYHVLYGDFHQISFPNNCYEFAFTNVIDHVFDLDRFSEEVYRVLKPNGLLLVEFGEVPIGGYEVLDTTSSKSILARFEQGFDLIAEEEIVNITNYINWTGKLLVYKKK